MRHITNCLNPNLSKLFTQTNKLEELQKLVIKLIPKDMQPHCKIGNFNNGCLTLVVSDAVWASQLRFIVPEIRDSLRKDAKLYELTNIKIKVKRNITQKDPEKDPEQNKEPSPWQTILDLLVSK